MVTSLFINSKHIHISPFFFNSCGFSLSCCFSESTLNGCLTFLVFSVEHLSMHSAAYFQLSFFYASYLIIFPWKSSPSAGSFGALKYTSWVFASIIILLSQSSHLQCTNSSLAPFPIQILSVFVSVSSQIANALPREWIVLLFFK